MLQIAVIGAGLAGIAAARRLSAAGHQVVVYEKSRGFGGRCATKRWLEHRVDHGAQYFTARDGRFLAALAECSGIETLASPILDAKGQARSDGPFLYHRDGQSRLARDLAGGSKVEWLLESPIVGIAPAEAGRWKIGGQVVDHIISTAPWPQTAQLFQLNETEPGVAYAPCVTALFAYEGEGIGNTAGCYGQQAAEAAALAWTACENHKVGRVAAGQTVLVAQLSLAASQTLLEQPADTYAAEIRPMVEAAWGLAGATLVQSVGHRWRYARPLATFSPPPLPPGLHYAGDALSRPRVESAWLAGLEMAESLI